QGRHVRLPGELRAPEGRRRGAGGAGRAGLEQLSAARRNLVRRGCRPPLWNRSCAAGPQPAPKTLLASNLVCTPSSRTGGIPMDQLRAAVNAKDPTALSGIGSLPIPDSYAGMVVRADEVDMFADLATADKDPRKSLHLQQVPTPEVGPGEALIAVLASAINYNTVWTSIFEPMSTFGFLQRYARSSELARKHDQPYHVVGSDLSGVVLRVGPGVTRWQ